MEQWVFNPHKYDNITLQYHWFDYRHQNSLAERELEASGLAYRIIDGYDINILRPDDKFAHRTGTGNHDCLHNCLPGKVDVYSRILLHYLLIDRSADDVQRLKAVVPAPRRNYRTRRQRTSTLN